LYNYKDFKAAFIKGDKQWHEKEWKNFILTIKQRAGNELILLFRDKMDEIVKLSPSSEDKFYKGLGKAMELIKIKYKI
jgi:hypothetical protein